MAQPTFGQIINDARVYLGDPSGGKYTNAYLLPRARMAVNRMLSVFNNNQLPQVSLIAVTTLPAGQSEIDPSTVPVLANLNTIEYLEERPTDGSTQLWTEVIMQDVLPQPYPAQATNVLGYYTNRGGKFQFNPASSDVDLRFTFFASGNADVADETVAINVDDCRNFLAFATGELAGIGKGDVTEAQFCRGQAYGENNKDPLNLLGGELAILVNNRLRVTQRSQIISPRYRAGAGRCGWGLTGRAPV